MEKGSGEVVSSLLRVSDSRVLVGGWSETWVCDAKGWTLVST